MNLIRGAICSGMPMKDYQASPDVVVCVRLYRPGVQEVFRRVAISLPFVLTPSLQFPLMLMRKMHVAYPLSGSCV